MPELHEQDVVVVGGGLAGLTVARELRHAGLEVVVLEARERLGGRAHTARLGGRDIELGGAHVHWLQPHVFAELTRYGIPYRPLPAPDRLAYWSEGRLNEAPLAEIGPRLAELFQRLFPDARETFPNRSPFPRPSRRWTRSPSGTASTPPNSPPRSGTWPALSSARGPRPRSRTRGF